jgi:hypothetical protein
MGEVHHREVHSGIDKPRKNCPVARRYWQPCLHKRVVVSGDDDPGGYVLAVEPSPPEQRRGTELFDADSFVGRPAHDGDGKAVQWSWPSVDGEARVGNLGRSGHRLLRAHGTSRFTLLRRCRLRAGESACG